MTIYEDLKRDLLAVARRHGKRALREAVRDAANGNLLQEDEDDIPPEDLDYPDEDVWTLPPAPEDEEKSGDKGTGEDESDEEELSDAAERVLDRLMDRLEKRVEE
jgi:hypothetical protein